MELLLGIDAGLTSIKAVLFTPLGQVAALASEKTRLLFGGDDRVEIEPKEQWKSACAAIGAALKRAGARPGDVRAVGVAAAGNGLYCLNGKGQPTRLAITSMDGRARLEARRLKKPSGDFSRGIWAGQPRPLVAWLKKHEPHILKQTETFLLSKDYLRYCLTGEANMDPTDASAAGLLDGERLAYGRLGAPFSRCLPPLVPSCGVAGRVHGRAARRTGLKAGTPVSAGLFDGLACALGSGVHRSGEVCLVVGTWGVDLQVEARGKAPCFVRQCLPFADGRKFAFVESSPTSMINLEWWMEKVGERMELKDLEKILRDYAPMEAAPCFLPFLQSGFCDDAPGASFYNLRPWNERVDLIGAIAEAIVFAHRWNLENLEREGLKRKSTVRLAGGISQSAAWRQFFADGLGRNVRVSSAGEAGALGAALTAGLAAGIYPTLSAAVREAAPSLAEHRPDKKKRHLFEKRYRAFLNRLPDGYPKGKR